jgi:fermentation-respiration switch protein FrsA (DUF1100 family)
MAHGAAGTRDLGLHAYAQRFAAAGLAVLLFDYQHFGESGGQPRQLWRNAFAARADLSLLTYRPGETASRVRAPMLVCVADFDTAGSVKLAVRARSGSLRAGELRRYPVSHFAVSAGNVMEQLLADETAFLSAHLLEDDRTSEGASS